MSPTDIHIPVIYTHREILLVLAALLGLIVFVVMRKGNTAQVILQVRQPDSTCRRKTSSVVKSQEEEWEYIPVEIFRHTVNMNSRFAVWKIGLFTAKVLVDSTHFHRSYECFFELAKQYEDADQVLAPLVRKVIGKYKEEFEKNLPLQISRSRSDAPLLTWLPNEACLRLAIFEFLDEALAISKVAKVSPSLRIIWGSELRVIVTWPRVAQLEVLRQLEDPEPEVEIQVTASTVSMGLWLAFTEKNIPRKIREMVEDVGNISQRSA